MREGWRGTRRRRRKSFYPVRKITALSSWSPRYKYRPCSWLRDVGAGSNARRKSSVEEGGADPPHSHPIPHDLQSNTCQEVRVPSADPPLSGTFTFQQIETSQHLNANDVFSSGKIARNSTYTYRTVCVCVCWSMSVVSREVQMLLAARVLENWTVIK